jgi:hypothetical protein
LASGVVTRRNRISRPSVVGSTLWALTRLLSNASALVGERVEPFRRSSCFSVAHGEPDVG